MIDPAEVFLAKAEESLAGAESEIANGRYGKEIDIYALGIILFEMLTGRVPFEGESVGEVLMKHLTAEPVLTEVPEPYRNVIARALAKDPATRFTSVAELMAALPNATPSLSYKPPIKETRHAGEPEFSPPSGRDPITTRQDQATRRAR